MGRLAAFADQEGGGPVNRRLLFATLILGLAFAIAGPASHAHAATVSGTVTDDYNGAVLSGIGVTLVGEMDSSQVATTTTLADGGYAFSGVGLSGYYMYFSDPADRYAPEWFDDSSDFWDAEPVYIEDESDAIDADAALSPIHIKYRIRLSTATVDPAEGASCLVGDSVSIATAATDAYRGYGLFGFPVMLQSSPDRSNWTAVGLALDPEWSGNYSATVVPARAGTTYYRFAIPDAMDSEATASASVQVHASTPSTSWRGVCAEGTSTADVTVGAARQNVRFRAQLLDARGAPKTGAAVRVQRSMDGRTWIDSSTTGRTSGSDGWYAATVTSGQFTFYRFVYVSTGPSDPTTVSNPLTIRSPWDLEWRSSRSVRHGTKCDFAGTVWPSVTSPKKLARVDVQFFKNGKWRAPKSAWAAAKKTGRCIRFSARVTLPQKGKYRVRVSVPRNDGYRLPVVSGAWRTVRAK
jgi:hypothetical protein